MRILLSLIAVLLLSAQSYAQCPNGRCLQRGVFVRAPFVSVAVQAPTPAQKSILMQSPVQVQSPVQKCDPAQKSYCFPQSSNWYAVVNPDGSLFRIRRGRGFVPAVLGRHITGRTIMAVQPPQIQPYP